MDPGNSSVEDMKQALADKYRAILIDKLTRQDLEEFQYYIRNQYDPEHGWNHEFRMKFEAKLRQYFHEEIIRREIPGIESVLVLLRPEDLKK